MSVGGIDDRPNPWRVALVELVNWLSDTMPTPYIMTCRTLLDHGLYKYQVREFLDDLGCSGDDIDDLFDNQLGWYDEDPS
jgi:hypothetical protein